MSAWSDQQSASEEAVKTSTIHYLESKNFTDLQLVAGKELVEEEQRYDRAIESH
ncbi:MAG: hypothetical protein AAGG53_02215 [Cyanobacteria bacterium P01_H01_bin.152]